jgi:hypothetical protein
VYMVCTITLIFSPTYTSDIVGVCEDTRHGGSS